MDVAAKSHWETLYAGKSEQEYSWFQSFPQTSIGFIGQFHLPPDARIIDIGGGDSRLVDALLERGFSNISVLDISAKAIEKAKQRLGDLAEKVHWIECDISEFEPEPGAFDLWHDRAAFHFLTTEPQVARYADMAGRAVCPGGYLVLGTFSPDGPKKCSGLDIRQYSRATMQAIFAPWFRRIRCAETEHLTPFQTKQHFLFCGFRRRR